MSNEKKEESFFKKILHSPQVEVILNILFIVMAITSMVSCIKAYGLLRSASADFGNIAVNWNTKPLMYVEVNSFTDCPNGWESVPILDFKGLEEGPCGCPRNAVYDGRSYDSSVSSCSTNQTKAGCLQDPGVNSLSLDKFLGKRTCIKRGGQAAVKSYYPWDRRPIPTEANTCQAGYKVCGSGTYESNKAICWPNHLDCPITSLFANGSSNSNITQVESVMEVHNFTRNVSESYNNDQWLFEGRKQLDHLPIVDFKIAFKAVQNQVEVGPCYWDYQNQEKYNGKAFWNGAASIKLNYPSRECEMYDTRFKNFVEQKESQLLLENFADVSVCSGKNMTINYDYYFNNSDKCAGDDCVFPNNNLNCESSDSICNGIKYQSKCGKYQMIARMAEQEDKLIGMFYRSQIEWKTDCASTELEVKDAVGPVQSTVKAQKALMVINIITNSLVGIIIPLMLIYNYWYGDVPCIPGEGDVEKKRILYLKGTFSHVLRSIKMIPLIITIILISKITDYFIELASEQCSDEITNYTVSFLARTLPDVMSSNILTLACDIITIILTIAVAFSEHTKTEKTTKVHPETEMTEMPESSEDQAARQKYNTILPEQKTWLFEQMISNNSQAQSYPEIRQIKIMNEIYDSQMATMMNPMLNNQIMGKTKKSMVIKVPGDARPGQILTVKTLEGIDVSYTVPPNGPGSAISFDYYV